MEVEIAGQKKQLRELKYLESVEIEETKQKEGLRAALKKFLIFSGLSDEEAENLGVKDGIRIQKELIKMTEDFQMPTEKAE